MEKSRRDTFDINNNDNNRNQTSTNDDKNKIRVEFEKYAKKGHPNQADFMELANKYPNNENIIEEYLKYRAKRNMSVKKQAKKAAENIIEKYNNGTKPLHEILQKMLKYKNKYEWSDLEFDEFRKELTNMLTGNRAMEIQYNQNLTPYRSRINKVLGSQRIIEEGLRIKDTEQADLAEILRMYVKYTQLHNRVFMQSLTYEDCSMVALTGEYKRERHNANNYIHPVLACMFIPKFDLFEFHMLYSNFGRIIDARNKRKQIFTEPDALLYQDIITDPNDVVCEANSAIVDLKNRFQVQINLWETVINLRNGQYYEGGAISDFISTLNNCRNNLFDNADLAYNQDEGAIMRKLLSVFSLRPTLIATKPINSLATFSQCGLNFTVGTPNSNLGGFQGLTPFNNQPVYTITSIPMITLTIPPYVNEQSEAIDLKSAATQTIWLNENKTIVPKEQSIIYSKEVLIFYVNRRVQRVQIKTYTNPLAFSQLPLTMDGMQRLNKYPVNVPDRISIQSTTDELYELRSVVAVSETSIIQAGTETSMITGTTGLIVSRRNPLNGVFQPNFYLYDPFGASLPVEHPLHNQVVDDPTCCNKHPYDGYITNKPISIINGYFTPNTDMGTSQSFIERASTTGTIFIYAKPSGYNHSEIIFA